MIPNSYPKVYQLGHHWIDGILEGEYIKNTLYKHFINNIKRGVCGGFAEWYKEQLLKNSFTEVA